MAEIRRELGGKPVGTALSPKAEAAPRKKRVLSAAARKRIAAAQKKRWAGFHKANRRAA
jgi:hypothetical protein